MNVTVNFCFKYWIKVSRNRLCLSVFFSIRVIPVYALERPRPELYERINRRVDLMFDEGLVEEVRRLMQAPRPIGGVAAQGVDYREVIEMLKGSGPLRGHGPGADPLEAIRQATGDLVPRTRGGPPWPVSGDEDPPRSPTAWQSRSSPGRAAVQFAELHFPRRACCANQPAGRPVHSRSRCAGAVPTFPYPVSSRIPQVSRRFRQRRRPGPFPRRGTVSMGRRIPIVLGLVCILAALARWPGAQPAGPPPRPPAGGTTSDLARGPRGRRCRPESGRRAIRLAE